ncbi:MAG: NfeD family protein [Bacteroidales bacterium]|nr:NfeD family protein [Bacteroidales bacterium]MCR4816564.1 NfeD family protein [Bacteroidales bacterium]
MELYYYWLIAAIILIIIEILTVGFGALCFAFGALATALAGYLGVSFTWQLAIFAIVSLLSFIFVRPFVLKFLQKKSKDVMTNADALIGRSGMVTEEIDHKRQLGRVKVDGDEWKAITEDGHTIAAGTEVTIIARDSIIVTVKEKTE